MASRFWVGGTGTWDGSSTTNWSATSGGAGGASVPTAADDVTFNGSSGGGVCTLGANVNCLTLNINTYTGTLAFGTNTITISGNAATIFTGGTAPSVSGTAVIICDYAGSTGTRFIVPGTTVTEANAISFSISAGSDIVGFQAAGVVNSLDFSGFLGTLNNSARSVYGNLILSAGMTLASGTGLCSFVSTSATPRTITSNNQTMDFPLGFSGLGGTWQLTDALSIGATRSMTLTRGNFDANNQNVSVGSFASSNSNVRTLTIGSGVWSILGSGTAWNTATTTSMTVTASSGQISMTSASAKTFAGGAKTWPTLNQGGSGDLTITGANTFADITNTVQPATITFPASTITTVSAFSVSGTSGNLITLNSSTSGTQATLSDASGVNSVSFCDIKDINATGGAIWNSLTSNGNIDGGNNLNWNFSVTPQTVTEVTYALRSFTQPRRF